VSEGWVGVTTASLSRRGGASVSGVMRVAESYSHWATSASIEVTRRWVFRPADFARPDTAREEVVAAPDPVVVILEAPVDCALKRVGVCP